MSIVAQTSEPTSIHVQPCCWSQETIPAVTQGSFAPLTNPRNILEPLPPDYKTPPLWDDITSQADTPLLRPIPGEARCVVGRSNTSLADHGSVRVHVLHL